ncbi:hypothetical protein H8E07_09220 [bacterium]|nr:hypothetical protein [bacterium]
MKTVIVAGAPRSGKSTLAGSLSRQRSLSRLPADSLVSALRDAFPELGVDHLEDHDLACARFKPFLKSWLGHLVYEDVPCVVDIYHLLPADVAELAPAWSVVFLGHPRIDPHGLLARIRDHARPQDWTEELDDAALLRVIEGSVAQSARLERDCAGLGLTFVDTGVDFAAGLARAYDALSSA